MENLNRGEKIYILEKTVLENFDRLNNILNSWNNNLEIFLARKYLEYRLENNVWASIWLLKNFIWQEIDFVRRELKAENISQILQNIFQNILVSWNIELPKNAYFWNLISIFEQKLEK